MKIVEIEISKIRGIPNLTLNFDGQSLLIWGPNGSGKSTVVDSIDFLLTGKISRLAGAGTSGISLTKHGTHIDHKPSDAFVRAKIKLDGFSDVIEIRRNIDSPETIHVLSGDPKAGLQIQRHATSSQIVLTRREILKYITSEAGKRSEEIQALLNISEIEDFRKALVKEKNSRVTEAKNAERNLEKAQLAIAAILSEKSFSESRTIAEVNLKRAILSAPSIDDLSTTKIKMGVSPPSVSKSEPDLNKDLVNTQIKNVDDHFDNCSLEKIVAFLGTLQPLIKRIKEDVQLIKALDHLDLLQMGQKLVTQDNVCPLCGVDWKETSLLSHLRAQIQKAEDAKKFQQQILQLCQPILESVTQLGETSKLLVPTVEKLGLGAHKALLEAWTARLRLVYSILKKPVESMDLLVYTPDYLWEQICPQEIAAATNELKKKVEEALPKATPQQNAWDFLTRMEENVKRLEEAHKEREKAVLFKDRAEKLHDGFNEARDKVLLELYQSINDRFSELYKNLHGPDESTFDSKLVPDGAKLKFEVDFHGRGHHPPHALHSEGHQDSMGLCLYLALIEKLNKGTIDLVVLDDVVMSVDGDHRRELCSVLKNKFPASQFLITTHDRTWANQLRSEGVVSRKQMIEFYNWNLTLGPQINGETEIWTKIKADLEKSDVPSAAAKLRRGSEEFFREVCDNLQARVKFRQSGQYELGDVMSAAISRLKEIQRMAKASAQYWKNDQLKAKIEEEESISNAIFERVGIENWAVNVNVHYNSWTNFSAKDFSPVVEAFADLFALFRCTSCGSTFRLTMANNVEQEIRCSCKQYSFNLVKR